MAVLGAGFTLKRHPSGRGVLVVDGNGVARPWPELPPQIERFLDLTFLVVRREETQVTECWCPDIAIAAPPVPPAPAYATAEVINGFVVGTTLVTGGEGYTEPPVVKVTGGNGQGATMSAEVADGRVVAVNVINPGSGYTTAPVITIAPPPTAPELSIRVTQVEVNMKLIEGKRYTIESSKNMVDWMQTEPLFVAEEQFMAVKFDVDEFGQFFRVIEQP